MQNPPVEGIEVLASLGGSAAGRVYFARADSGEDVIAKVFHEGFIRRDLLVDSTRRLKEGGWPDGVLPVLSDKFDGESCVRLTPALLDVAADGSLVPRSLQHHFDDHAMGMAAEGVVRGVAGALAGMHARGVVHGNIKPCNVMFGKGGGVFLTDWSLGNMPGVREFSFTDALLYQAPEQLIHSESMKSAGLRWDVFAFGVLAFRLLAGRFPRCNATYQKVAPLSGRACGDVCLMVDREKVAANLWREPEVVWPEECIRALDPVLREVIYRCLVLDPAQRPASMLEVADLLGEEVKPVPRKSLAQRVSMFPAMGWRMGFVGMALVAVWLGVVAVRNAQRWQNAVSAGERQSRVGRQNEEGWEKEKHQWEEERRKWALESEKEIAARAEVQSELEKLRNQGELARVQLEASREIGDALFVWAMEKGHRELPPLDGRTLRLKRLEGYFLDFLGKTESIGELSDERARVRLQLGEISLALGNEVQAFTRLEEAIRAMSDVPMDDEMRIRMATNRLLLAILKKRYAAADAGEAFVAARKALVNAFAAQNDSIRKVRMVAVLDFHEAQWQWAAGKTDEALKQLMRAIESLTRLADAEPDVAILRSELAACHLSSAMIWEGLGNLADAHQARIQAKTVLEKMLEKSPDDIAAKVELAGCVGAMAEASFMAGDSTEAESLSNEAMRYLDEILRRQPEHHEAISRRAVQLGLRAGLLRDQGFAEEADEDYQRGIRMLEQLRASSPGPSMVSYRLAVLLWQSGRMTGADGKRESEIGMLAKAKALLVELEEGKGVEGMIPQQVRKTFVYVLGDLGHAHQMDGKNDKALELFREALVLWEKLSKAEPRSEEFSEGLVWCRQRVEELEKAAED